MIDLSGSMYYGEKSIFMAVNALKLFVHSLPFGCKFNICKFGTTFKFIFKNSVEFNDQNMEIAINDINTYSNFSNCLGGTEIYNPIEYILNSQPCKNL
jgi:hypothetical protein